MTGSALQALGVELTCDSSCKGRGVWGEGGGPFCQELGWRISLEALKAWQARCFRDI